MLRGVGKVVLSGRCGRSSFLIESISVTPSPFSLVLRNVAIIISSEHRAFGLLFDRLGTILIRF